MAQWVKEPTAEPEFTSQDQYDRERELTPVESPLTSTYIIACVPLMSIHK